MLCACSQSPTEEQVIYATKEGNTKMMLRLLHRGANANARMDGDYTALMWAAGNGNAETVKLLLENGADVNAKDQDGDTAYEAATASESPETMQVIKEFSKRK